MLERLKDKVAEIRAQAVNALQRLQDPKDDQCPIIKAFIFHMGCDPSPIVRKVSFIYYVSQGPLKKWTEHSSEFNEFSTKT